MKSTFKSVATVLSVLSLAAVTFACNQHSQKPNEQNKEASQTAQKSDFIGNWKVADGDNVTFYVTINPDGTAISTWGEGQNGTWRMSGDKIEVTWSDGWINTLYKTGSTYKKNAYAPGTQLDGMPTNSSNAEKVATVPPSAQPQPVPAPSQPTPPQPAPAPTPPQPKQSQVTPQKPNSSNPSQQSAYRTNGQPQRNQSSPTTWRR